MKRKALKNIPKPDEEKLAIFYGKKTAPAETPKREPEMSTVDKMSTVVKKTTVDKMSTVGQEPYALTALQKAGLNSPGEEENKAD